MASGPKRQATCEASNVTVVRFTCSLTSSAPATLAAGLVVIARVLIIVLVIILTIVIAARCVSLPAFFRSVSESERKPASCRLLWNSLDQAISARFMARLRQERVAATQSGHTGLRPGPKGH
jgi:hypothetical protein